MSTSGIYRANDRLSYDREPGFVSRNYQDNISIIFVQLVTTLATPPTSPIRVFIPRQYQNLRSITLERVDVPTGSTTEQVQIEFLNASHTQLFEVNQLAQDTNIVQKGICCPTGRSLRWRLGNWRDCTGRLDQEIWLRFTAPPYDSTESLPDGRFLITLSLECALWT